MRGWASGEPQEAYEKGLAQSVEMYYRIANLNVSIPHPDAGVMDAFIGNSAASCNNTMEQIATQKWIHFFITQPYEAFAELRRTDYPVLPDDTYSGNPLPSAVRLVYPPSEMANNPEHYQAQKADDRYDRRVWWDVQ